MGEPVQLRSMTLPEILDGAFRLYRQNFVTFLGILGVVYVPFVVLIMAVSAMMVSGAATAAREEDVEAVMQSQMTGGLVLLGFTVLLFSVAMPLATGALTRAVGSRYLNEAVSLGGCYKHILGMFWRYLLTVLLSGLVIVIGFMLLVVPGIVFSIWFIFTSSVVVLEGLGGTSAMGRSRELARGNAGKIILLAVLIWILSWLLGVGVEALNGLIVSGMEDSRVMAALVSQVIQQGVNLVVAPFFSIAWVLLYYDIRIRKEGFDLEVLARSLGSGPGSAPATPA